MDQTFRTPEEEIVYLRSQIEAKKSVAQDYEAYFKPEDHAHEVIREYKAATLEMVSEVQPVSSGETHRLVDWLTPKSTDDQVEGLLAVVGEKGVKNAIAVAGALNDAEVEDDFERALVQYLLSDHSIGRDVSKEEWKALHMKLFEIILPEAGEGGGRQAKEMMAFMEQWYASMQALSSDPANKEKNYYSLELAVSNGSTVASFYCAVHVDYAPLFEKIVLGVFPQAKVLERKDDYNIFHNHAITSTAYATSSTNTVLPIRTYADMQADPMTVLLSSFTRIQKENEGLALQILIRPAGEVFAKRYGTMLDDLRKGESLKRVLDKQSILKESAHLLVQMFSSKTEEELKKEQAEKHSHVDDTATKLVQEKLSKTIVETNIRIIASAETMSRAQAIKNDVEASFAQYALAGGNSFRFEEVTGRKQQAMLHRFSYRLWNDDESYPLNIAELATIFHLPEQARGVSNIKNAVAATAAAPLDMPEEGVVLGVNVTTNGKQTIHMSREDRMRHLYVIGQTGTGKTTLLKNLIVQDILNGDGCCFIDPHGTDIVDILAQIPKERMDDVIYFDPSYTERPVGLNMLEYDKNYPEQKTFIVNELLNIFDKLFDMRANGGPGFEQYFRQATLLVMEHPESGNTLLEIVRVFSDKDFRDYKLMKTKNPLLIQFWQNAEKTTGEQGLQNWTNYVTSKFDIFLSNDIMRPVIAQEKSAFNIREIMDNKKIFLVNLSKGRLGEKNAELIGLILVGKFLQAALSRVDTDVRPDFYLYIDEFHNITTPAISAILSEARKYRLSLNIVHQYIAQLPEDIKNAVFGNVGSMAIFRVGPDDAKYLETQFAPTFTAADIIKIENGHAYIKMLVRGEPKKPFDIQAFPPGQGNREQINPLKELSYLTYGRDRAEVEAEILRKYQM